MSKNNKNLLLYSIILFVVLIAAYSNHFSNGFHFDDSHAVVDNIHIRTIKNIPAYFSDPKMFSADPTHWGLRPVVTATLAIDYWLAGGLNPFYFQLSTFIWYVLLCSLLFFIYKHLLIRSINHRWAPYIALTAAAWFALHTANAETVNYIIARSDVLSTFCIAASFLIYVVYPEKRKYCLYIIPAFIGVFAKETVLVLVILLFFYILLFEKGMSVQGLFFPSKFGVILNTVGKLLPLTIVIVLTQVYTLSKISSVPGITNPLGYYILTQSYVWLHYFISFFLPLNLSADTDWTVITNMFDERIILGLAFIVALVTAIVKTSAKTETKPVAFGLLWFSASLLPTSLAPFAEVTNDHRMFFAFVGLALSVTTWIGLWLVKPGTAIIESKIRRNAILACTFVVLSLHAYGVRQRNKVWNNEESLWLDVTVKSSLNGRGLMNYGLTQMAKGNYDAAGLYFNKAAQYLPLYATLYINLGVLNGAVNKPVEAEANYKKAIMLSPNTFDGYAYYAAWLDKVNRVNEAIDMGKKALQINPYSVMAFNVIMDADNKMGFWDDLQQTANQKLAILPGDPVAKTYLEAGKTHVPVITAVSAPKPAAPTAAYFLDQSLIYYNQQNYNRCIEACWKALKLKPDYADAYSNMGAAYNQLKQFDKGVDACKKALAIDPNHKLANGNLNWALNELKKQGK